MMKRLIVTAPRGSGGAITHARHIVPELLRKRPGWRVEVHAPPDLLRAAFGRDDHPWMFPLDGNDYGSRLLWELLDMPKRSKSEGPTLVYAPFGPMLNVAAARGAIWASRNIIPLLARDTWEISSRDVPRTLALRLLVLANARLARTTICVSNFARDRLVHLAPAARGRIAVIPHGADRADPERACVDPRAEGVRSRPFVLNVGQPTPYRRTRELILAFSHLLVRRHDLPQLVVVGAPRPADRGYGAECLRLLEPLIRAGNATYLGALGHEDVMALTSAADVVAYPSVHEDCPNAVLEALAARRVIVCADIPATRELAGNEGAVFVRDPTPDCLAEALERAIFEAPLRARLQSVVAERAAIFTWERTAASTMRLLDEAFEDLLG